MTISETKGIRLSKHANKVIGTVHHHSTSVNLMNTILTFTFPFKKEYKERFVATGIQENVRDMMGSVFMTGRNARS